MSDQPDSTFERPDPRERPDDPAGTKPKVDAESLLPAIREPLVPAPARTADEPVNVQVVDGDLLPERAANAGPLGGYRPRDSAHTPRFQFLLGALFALGLAAVAAIAAIAINGTPERTPEQAWSDWKPTGGNAPAQIAQHVGQRYLQENGRQLVLVQGGPLEVSNTPLQLVVSQGGNYYPVGGKAVLYNLCGLGGACRIDGGTPSEERLLLLQRESLELALYTFRYTDADNVVAIFPPTADKRTRKFKKRQDLAMFLQRKDVEEQLKRPLATTLTATPPQVSTIVQSPDIGSVQSLASPRSFNFKLLSGGTDGAYMVLQRIG